MEVSVLVLVKVVKGETSPIDWQTLCKDNRIFKRNETYYHLPKESVDFPAVKEAGAWMLEWPIEALAAWVDELKYWDGTQQPNFTWIYGTSRKHMEWMHTICLLVGQSASYCPNQGHDCARVGLNAYKNVRIGQLKIESNYRTVRVYCPTVPSSGFLIRRNGKIMFSLNSNYFGTPRTMAMHLKVETSLMEDFQYKYFKQFPGIRDWHAWIARQLQTEGFITTPMGRCRWFWSRLHDDSTLRAAIAFQPQSTIADVLNTGMLRVYQKFEPDVHLHCQIHDALVLAVPETKLDYYIPLLKKNWS